VQQNIGGNKGIAWMKYAHSPGNQVQGSGELKVFTVKGDVSGSHQTLDTKKRGGPGLTEQQLTNVIKQTWPPGITQMVNERMR